MKSQNGVHRPVDLARAHGLSAQAVRNYERAGVIPPAERTASGYRVYTDRHVAALGAYVALLPGYGYRAAAEIMRAVLRDDLPAALAVIDTEHVRLQRDRETVASVASAASVLASSAAPGPAANGPGARGTSVRDAAPGGGVRGAVPGGGGAVPGGGGAVPGAGRSGAVLGGPVPVGVLAHRLDVTPATLRKWERAGILDPARAGNARVYSPEDIRDAELAHLLRRGGYRLDHIAAVVRQVRAAGGPGPLAASIDGWRARITARGRAMLTGSARLAGFLETHAAPPVGVTGGAAVQGDQ